MLAASTFFVSVFPNVKATRYRSFSCVPWDMVDSGWGYFWLSQNGKEVCFWHLLAKARGAVVGSILCIEASFSIRMFDTQCPQCPKHSMAASSPSECLAPNACNAQTTAWQLSSSPECLVPNAHNALNTVWQLPSPSECLAPNACSAPNTEYDIHPLSAIVSWWWWW